MSLKIFLFLIACNGLILLFVHTVYTGITSVDAFVVTVAGVKFT